MGVECCASDNADTTTTKTIEDPYKASGKLDVDGQQGIIRQSTA